MPAVRSTTSAKSKASEARGKSKAPVASTSAIGAPAQYKQTNRKGKKAWRKNIDIQPEEQALEKVREIEQALGYVGISTSGLYDKFIDKVYMSKGLNLPQRARLLSLSMLKEMQKVCIIVLLFLGIR